MRFAFADPPYPGQSLKRYGDHPDYAGEVDHRKLAEQLREYDGWVLHTSAPALFYVQQCLALAGMLPTQDHWGTCDECHMPCIAPGWQNADKPPTGSGDYRVFAWVKPFAAFKRNVSPAYAWEPVIVKPLRKGEPNQRLDSPVMRDWLAESITMKKGLTGAKPEKVCRWLFEACGLRPDDELHDLFPGSGAVTRAWDSWRSTPQLAA